MKPRFNLYAGPALLALSGLLCPSALHATQILVNGGFENGVYTSTINSNTNFSVPVGWTPNAAYDLEPGFNHVVNNPVYDGNYALSIGNYDYQPVPTLSQTFADVSGSSYSGSIFVDYGGGQGEDSGASFDVWIDGVELVAVDDTSTNGWNEFTFSFTGTGSDTITIGGDTNPSEWYVDDVSVTGSAAPFVPEPSSLLLLATGLAGLAFVARRKLVL